jgi:hypothetical protein
MTYVNAGAALLVVALGLWYAVKGRKIDRGMMVVNVISGMWLVVAYTLIFVDALWVDIITPDQITCYVIRPALFVLLAAKIANIIRIGRRDGHVN